MSSENTLTGHKGKFQIESFTIVRATQWAVNPTLATKSEWGDSDSAGFTNRAAGRKDSTFTAEGKYHRTNEVFDIFTPGDILKAVLWLDRSTARLYWLFPRALCDDFSLSVNMDTMEVSGWTSKWGADGKFYYPGSTAAYSGDAAPAQEAVVSAVPYL